MKKQLLRTIYRLGYRVAPLVWRLTRPRVEGAMVAVRAGDRVLFVRNSYRPEWSLPGGGIHPNETPALAAIRELREEIGWRVEASELRLIGEAVFVWRHRDDRVTLFVHRAQAPQAIAIDGVEVVEARFLSGAAAAALALQPHVRQFLPAIFA